MRIFSLLFLLPFVGFAQADLTVSPTVTNPVDGCELGTETVTITILNTSVTPHTGLTGIGFQLNGGTPVVETANITLGGSAAYIYTFTATADLSACQQHDMILFVYSLTDPNNANDSISYSVISDCPAMAGTFVGDTSGCISGVDSVTHTGYTGNISEWITSTDGGLSWNTTGVSTDNFDVSGLPADAEVAVIIDSPFGLCLPDTAYITVNCTAGINDQNKPELTIPSTVDKNGSYWKIIGLENYPNNQLTIYNLQGQIVFKTNSYQNNWNGSESEPGVYLYQLKIDNQEFKGKLLLR